MSIPITACLISKATKSEQAYQNLLERMKVNVVHGHFSQWPCEHNPPCTMPTDEELDKLNERLTKDLAGIEPDPSPPGVQGSPGISPDKVV